MDFLKLFRLNLLSNKEICFNNVDEMNTFCKNCIDISIIIKEYYYYKDKRAFDTLHEWYDLSKLLIQFHNNFKIQYPLDITKSESPDFIINYKEDRIGIEHTTGQTQKHAYATHKLQISESDSIMEIVPELAEQGRPKKNEFDYLIKNKNEELDQPPAYGNALEKQWANVMFNCIKNKTKKLNHNYNIQNQNILLISENTLPTAKKAIKLNYLKNQYKEFLNQKQFRFYFGDIYIIANKWIEKIT
ncbi:MAG: hypothetical protein KAU01_05310 [Candidatus Cloacimonetes bacterium]|nr:hypothetical protein [Candidatus Cloacimonadota bacterium]